MVGVADDSNDTSAPCTLPDIVFLKGRFGDTGALQVALSASYPALEHVHHEHFWTTVQTSRVARRDMIAALANAGRWDAQADFKQHVARTPAAREEPVRPAAGPLVLSLAQAFKTKFPNPEERMDWPHIVFLQDRVDESRFRVDMLAWGHAAGNEYGRRAVHVAGLGPGRMWEALKAAAMKVGHIAEVLERMAVPEPSLQPLCYCEHTLQENRVGILMPCRHIFCPDCARCCVQAGACGVCITTVVNCVMVAPV